MKNLLMQILYIIILISATLFVSCDKGPDHIDFGCGLVQTEIVELDFKVGSYTDAIFSNIDSTNFENAAIAIIVDDFEITTETEHSCFEFTPLPQLVEAIEITSNNSVTSQGTVYSQGEELIELFKLHSKDVTYNVLEFIDEQNEEPLLYYDQGDELFLQLLNQPDATINQSFEIQFTFTDSKTLSIVIPIFKVVK